MRKHELDDEIHGLPNILNGQDLNDQAFELLNNIGRIFYSQNNPLTAQESRNLTFLQQKVAHTDHSTYIRASEIIKDGLSSSQSESDSKSWQPYAHFVNERLFSKFN